MDRPIRFMQLDDEGKWHYWGFLVDDYLEEASTGAFTLPCSVSSEESYQFTGRLDKDGKEIYDGHTIRCYDSSEYEVIWSKRACKFCIRKIVRGTYGYNIKRINSIPDAKNVEIIGHKAGDK